MSYLVQDRSQYEAPCCPNCGKRHHVEWIEVTTVHEATRGERRVLPGRNYCTTPGCPHSLVEIKVINNPQADTYVEKLRSSSGEDVARTAIKLYAAIHPGCTHQLRWVISPAMREELLTYTSQRCTGWDPAASTYRPQRTPQGPETIFGLPIRVDEHATTIMLELR